MRRPRRADTAAPRTSLPVVLVALVVVAAVTVGGGSQTLDRLRVDTPVQAVAQGKPGCVNAATFTGPDGVVRRVDVTVYKGACQDLDPGDAMTVYYDAGDPAVTAPSQAWWWTLLPTLVALAMGAFLVRSAIRHVVGARRDR